MSKTLIQKGQDTFNRVTGLVSDQTRSELMEVAPGLAPGPTPQSYQEHVDTVTRW